MHCYITDNFIAEFGEAYVTITYMARCLRVHRDKRNEVTITYIFSVGRPSAIPKLAIIIERNMSFELRNGNDGNTLSSIQGIIWTD